MMTKKEKELVSQIDKDLAKVEQFIDDLKSFGVFLLVIGGMFLVSILAAHCS